MFYRKLKCLFFYRTPIKSDTILIILLHAFYIIYTNCIFLYHAVHKYGTKVLSHENRKSKPFPFLKIKTEHHRSKVSSWFLNIPEQKNKDISSLIKKSEKSELTVTQNYFSSLSSVYAYALCRYDL